MTRNLKKFRSLRKIVTVDDGESMFMWYVMCVCVCVVLTVWDVFYVLCIEQEFAIF